jgi:Holliday junction resolvasome RuvABC endonuclease subunit
MKVLGLDPSLTNYGWALLDTDAPYGTRSRCLGRGRFSTKSSVEFVERYCFFRSSLQDLLDTVKPDRVGIEFPVFDSMFSSGMYGLFLYSCEALKSRGMDTVFWSPPQVKAHARDSIDRPEGWFMEKADMVEAAQKDCDARMNHNEADAFLIAVLSSRFWLFLEGEVDQGGLTPTEDRYFTAIHTYTRGPKAGRSVNRGVAHRENDRFFLWSNTLGETKDGI